MYTGSSPARRSASTVRGTVIAGLALALLMPASAALAEDAIDSVGNACQAVVPDIGAWLDSQGQVLSALAGTWTVTAGSIGDTKIMKDELWVESHLEDETVLVEEFSRGDEVVYRSLTGRDGESGDFVSLWSAGSESCLQLRGSFESADEGKTATRQMSSADGEVELDLRYLRSASGERPTDCIKAGYPCSRKKGSTPCCSSTCSGGTCPCLPAGKTCSEDKNCCSGDCSSNSCA